MIQCNIPKVIGSILTLVGHIFQLAQFEHIHSTGPQGEWVSDFHTILYDVHCVSVTEQTTAKCYIFVLYTKTLEILPS